MSLTHAATQPVNDSMALRDDLSNNSNPVSETQVSEKKRVTMKQGTVEVMGTIGKQQFGLVLQESKSSRLHRSSNGGSQESVNLKAKINHETGRFNTETSP